MIASLFNGSMILWALNFFSVSGVDHNLINKILNPHHLSKIEATFGNLSRIIQTDGPWASAWVGEAGGAFNNGGRHVSDTFVNSFWYSFFCHILVL